MRRLEREFRDRPGLASHAPAVAEYLDDRRSKETADSVEKRFIAFIDWAERIDSQREPLELPISPERMLRYARYLDGEKLAKTTIYNYLATIGAVHKALGHFAPANHPVVKEFLADMRVRRASDERRRATALSERELCDVLENLQAPRRTRGGRQESDDAMRERAGVDRALITTMVQAGLRRGEAAALTWGDFAEVMDGSGRVRIHSGGSEDTGHVLTVARETVAALMAVKPENAGDSDLIFRLSGSQISRRLKTMCAAAGIDSRNVSGNTPRATLERILTDRGAPTEFIHRQLRLRPPYKQSPYSVDHASIDALRWLESETVRRSALWNDP